jgi:pSer/pThr/pTyr-binding forkhead associated (FHA) protein
MPGMTLAVGRDPTNDIFAPVAEISRTAAIFSTDSTKVTVTDLHTRGGVYVNDERIPPGQAVILKDNDVVRLAHSSYTLELHSLRTK